jgi:hypothetical protein
MASQTPTLRYLPSTSISQDGTDMTRAAESHSVSSDVAVQPYLHRQEYTRPQSQHNAGHAPPIQQPTFAIGWYPHQPFATLAEEPEHYGSAQSRPG